MYSREEEMYPDVREWLEDRLRRVMKDADVRVYVTSRTTVADLIEREHLTRYFGDIYRTYDIMVDITGIIIRNNKGELAFIECKLNKISLRELSQLLGYSVVARPRYSMIISPRGTSDSLRTLLISYRRTDILEYAHGRKIAVAQWNADKKDIDYATIIPSGWSF
jgi:hypothetical protein